MTGGRRSAVAVALLALVLAGCTSEGGGGGAEGGSSDEATQGGQEERAVTTSPPRLPKVPALDEERGIVEHLALDECPTAEGPGRAAGEVTNPAAEARDVVVVLNWTNDTYDVLGRHVLVLKDVGPGATEGWSHEVDLRDGVTTCTPSARIGKLRARG